MPKKILLLVLPILVSCQAIEEADKKIELEYFPPVGSVWVLEKKVVAPNRTVHLMIIDGKVHDSFLRWNSYKTACSLDFKTMTSDKKEVKPARFVITKVDTEEQTINSTTGNFITIMHVTSTDNSYIESITCQSWNSYSSTPYVTVESMIKATKGIMSLEIKQLGNDNKIKTEK
ncbi:MAG: hypothetical protein LJE73_08915 [Proteobacteria bacterium]|jgi:hypothetical protein|nr:hypothetical protein [Pseudomonadota bacterium]